MLHKVEINLIAKEMNYMQEAIYFHQLFLILPHKAWHSVSHVKKLNI